MSKTIIINENIVNSMVFNQIPKSIRLALLRKHIPLGNNPALPYDEFIEDAILKSYKSLPNIDTSASLSELQVNIMKQEEDFKSFLEQLCAYECFKLFQIGEEDIDARIELKPEIKANVQVTPDENNTYKLEDVKQLEYVKKEVGKRKLLNTLIAGGAYHYTLMVLDSCKDKLDKYNENLYPQYKKYLELNQCLLFKTANIKITQKDKKQGGISIVTLGDEKKKNQLYVEALIFPILVYETLKGLMEIFIAHGLPEDSNLRNVVLSKSDYVLAEPWNMRFGPILWHYFTSVNIPTNAIPYSLMRVSKLPSEKFNRLFQEVFAETQRGEEIMGMIKTYAMKKSSQQNFDLKINTNVNLISDEYIASYEL